MCCLPAHLMLTPFVPPFSIRLQHIQTELIAEIQRNAANSVQTVFDHFVHLHSQLQMREQVAMAELKARAQLAIAHCGQLAPLVRQSGRRVAEVLRRLTRLCRDVPANVNLPMLIGEVNMMLERTHCSLGFDAHAPFR